MGQVYSVANPIGTYKKELNRAFVKSKISVKEDLKILQSAIVKTAMASIGAVFSTCYGACLVKLSFTAVAASGVGAVALASIFAVVYLRRAIINYKLSPLKRVLDRTKEGQVRNSKETEKLKKFLDENYFKYQKQIHALVYKYSKAVQVSVCREFQISPFRGLKEFFEYYRSDDWKVFSWNKGNLDIEESDIARRVDHDGKMIHLKKYVMTGLKEKIKGLQKSSKITKEEQRLFERGIDKLTCKMQWIVDHSSNLGNSELVAKKESFEQELNKLYFELEIRELGINWPKIRERIIQFKESAICDMFDDYRIRHVVHDDAFYNFFLEYDAMSGAYYSKIKENMKLFIEEWDFAGMLNSEKYSDTTRVIKTDYTRIFDEGFYEFFYEMLFGYHLYLDKSKKDESEGNIIRNFHQEKLFRQFYQAFALKKNF
ncbi:MAG TPA: hypothetical protein P5048_02790 [Chlamydiales bacterium]|nr:hypothetical protein [Chlamydiales bacterium]